MFDSLSQRSNSDFFPILSLEAPRTRFLSSRPMALLGVNVADLPVREVLAHIAPPIPGQFLADQTYIPSELAAQSVFVAAALADTRGAADTPLAHAVATMRDVIAACTDDSDDSQKIDMLQQLAARMIPYLDAVQLQQVLIEPAWITCSTPTEAVGAMRRVVSALARRDFARAGLEALSLSQAHKHVLSQTVRDWLLRVAMLSAIAQQRYADVATYDATVGSDITSAGWNRLQRDYLLAFARAQLLRTPTSQH